MKREVKGQSGIITNILIILIVITVVATAWIVIEGVIRRSSKEVSIKQFDINLKIESAYISDTNDSLKIEVRRLAGKGNLTSLRFVLEDKNRESFSKEIFAETTELPGELETIVYEFSISHFAGLIDFSNITKISLVYGTRISYGNVNYMPALNTLNNYNNNFRDKYSGANDDSFVTLGESCYPESASETCGTWVCGIRTNNCGDSINCLPGCSDGKVCISGSCVCPAGEVEYGRGCAINVNALEFFPPYIGYSLSQNGRAYVLTEDIDVEDVCNLIGSSCSGYGSDIISIHASNIVLDGRGHSIFGKGDYSGISAGNRNNITIKNFKNITGFDKWAYVSLGSGIFFSAVNNSLIYNVTCDANYIGIFITSYTPNSNINNTLRKVSTRFNDRGIYMHSTYPAYKNLDNKIENSVSCNNTQGDLHIFSSLGCSGTGNMFGAVNSACGGWPVLGADYDAC